MNSIACCAAVAVATLAVPLSAQRHIDLNVTPVAIAADEWSSISSVRELDGMRVLVTDPFEHTVVLANFHGTIGQRVGTVGSGPGEYRFPGGLMPASSGVTTWLYDPALTRLSVISELGRIESRAYAAPGNVLGMRGSDRAGNLYFEGNEYDPATGGFSRTVPILRYQPESGTSAVVTRVSTGGRVLLQRAGGPMSMARTSTPYPRIDAWVPLPDGRVAIVRADTFRVDFVAANGAVTRGAVLPDAPIAVGESERAAFRDVQSTRRMSATSRGGSDGPAMPALEWRDEDFPKVLPPFRHDAVLVSPEGEIWIGRSTTSASPKHTYDIVSAGGRIVGNASLPANSSVVGFGRGVVYVSRTDRNTGVVRLAKYTR